MIERLNQAANILTAHTMGAVKLAAWRAYGDAMPDDIFKEFVSHRRYYKTDVFYLFGKPFVAVKDPRNQLTDRGVGVFVEVIQIYVD